MIKSILSWFKFGKNDATTVTADDSKLVSGNCSTDQTIASPMMVQLRDLAKTQREHSKKFDQILNLLGEILRIQGRLEDSVSERKHEVLSTQPSNETLGEPARKKQNIKSASNLVVAADIGPANVIEFWNELKNGGVFKLSKLQSIIGSNMRVSCMEFHNDFMMVSVQAARSGATARYLLPNWQRSADSMSAYFVFAGDDRRLCPSQLITLATVSDSGELINKGEIE